MNDLSKVYSTIKKTQDECVVLYDIFESTIFSNVDMTQIKSVIPLWIVDAGISAESPLEKVVFEKLVNANNNEFTHKILYGFDCQTLIATLQDRLSSLDDLIHYLFQNISSKAKYQDKEYERGIKHMGPQATVCFTFLNSIFISIGSVLDIVTKIAIEIEAIKEGRVNFATYPKLKSNGKLYGQRTLINLKLFTNTIFEEPAIIRKVISIRDEIVHNGTWDYRHTVYGGFKGDDYEEWIMMPDFESSGTFVSYKNRKRFYSKGDKMNIVIIPFLTDILELVNKTLESINALYLVDEKAKIYDIKSFSKEITNWTLSFIQIFNKDEY